MLLLYPLTLPTCSGYEVETQMNVSERTKSSIAQFLGLFSKDDISFLMGKHSISTDSVVNYDYMYGISIDSAALQAVRDADSNSIASLLEEIVQTSDCLRHKVSPRKRFDDRWNDLKKCLMLDGFKVENETIHRIEPMIEGCLIVDDLAKELESIPLADSKNIIESIRLSAECFLKSTPDYNGCLFHARIALETLIRGIALCRGYKEKGKTAWGESLRYLREIEFLTPKYEETISSIYTFVSDSAHVRIPEKTTEEEFVGHSSFPAGFTGEEYARFCRNLLISTCYFVSKLLKGNKI